MHLFIPSLLLTHALAWSKVGSELTLLVSPEKTISEKPKTVDEAETLMKKVVFKSKTLCTIEEIDYSMKIEEMEDSNMNSSSEKVVWLTAA